MNIRRVLSFIVLSVVLSGCGVAAAPCRLTGAVIKIIPLIGDPVGELLEACGDIID
jgi:hypothetical protein